MHIEFRQSRKIPQSKMNREGGRVNKLKLYYPQWGGG